eukprot:3952498-Amphidinium_carterae.1
MSSHEVGDVGTTLSVPNDFREVEGMHVRMIRRMGFILSNMFMYVNSLAMNHMNLTSRVMDAIHDPDAAFASQIADGGHDFGAARSFVRDDEEPFCVSGFDILRLAYLKATFGHCLEIARARFQDDFDPTTPWVAALR